METKKTWEYVSLVLIPKIRLSHCPYLRISNVKPAHVSDDIYTPRRRIPKETITITLTITIHIRKDSTPLEQGTPYYIYKGKLAAGRYKINPRERFLLHHRCTWIQSCEV